MSSHRATHNGTNPAIGVTNVVAGCSIGVAVMLLVLLLALIALCRSRCRCCIRQRKRKRKQTKDVVEEQPETRKSEHEYLELFRGDYDQAYLPQLCPDTGTDGYLTASPSSGCGQYTTGGDNNYQENEIKNTKNNTKVSSFNRRVCLEIKDPQTVNIYL